MPRTVAGNIKLKCKRTTQADVREASRVIPSSMELDQSELNLGHVGPSFIELSRVTPLSKQCERVSPNTY
jgi:hypothetical protein